jgi:hypothetical protein
MRYICFTAKHHDGFCLWDTRQTDFNIMNTPYKRDVLRQLADACDRRGMNCPCTTRSRTGTIPMPTTRPARTSARPRPATSRIRSATARSSRSRSGNCSPGTGGIHLVLGYSASYRRPGNQRLRALAATGILINDRGYDPGDFRRRSGRCRTGPGSNGRRKPASRSDGKAGATRPGRLLHDPPPYKQHRQGHGHGRQLPAECRPDGGRPHRPGLRGKGACGRGLV